MGYVGLKYEVVVLGSEAKVVEILPLLTVKDFGYFDCKYFGFIRIPDSQAACPELDLEEYTLN